MLNDLGALTQDERLIELGEKLGSLPVHPSTSKMLLFGKWCFSTIFSKLKLKIQMIC
jgi:HrpA-like RNA helicase